MSKLSNSDSRTIRLAREAIGLVIDGAMRRLESQFGPDDNPDRSIAADALILHAREEVEGWVTAHEMGDTPAERSSEDTALTNSTD